MKPLHDLNFMIKTGWLLPAILMFSCGKHFDANEDLKAGYQFRRGKVIELNNKTYTIKSFGIADTFPEFERYVIVDTPRKSDVTLPFNGPHGEGIVLKKSTTYNYGAASFDGEIVIFPRFYNWIDLGKGYFGVRKFKNVDEWGVLHIRGEMVTDIKYNWLGKDSLTNNIICRYGPDSSWTYDTIYVTKAHLLKK